LRITPGSGPDVETAKISGSRPRRTPLSELSSASLQVRACPRRSYTRENYNDPATVLETKDRRDERLRQGSAPTYRINESWSLELNYQFSKNNSTCDLYDYEQHFVSTGVAWSF
jgi:hypothetical protein